MAQLAWKSVYAGKQSQAVALLNRRLKKKCLSRSRAYVQKNTRVGLIQFFAPPDVPRKLSTGLAKQLRSVRLGVGRSVYAVAPLLSQKSGRFMLWASLAIPILAFARAVPMVLTNTPMRSFSSANRCSTWTLEFGRAALARPWRW